MAASLQTTYIQQCLLNFLIITSLLTVGALAEPSSPPLTKALDRTVQSEKQTWARPLRSVHISAAVKLMRHRYERALGFRNGGWTWVQLMALCSLVTVLGVWKKRRAAENRGLKNAGTLVHAGNTSVREKSNSLGKLQWTCIPTSHDIRR